MANSLVCARGASAAAGKIVRAGHVSGGRRRYFEALESRTLLSAYVVSSSGSDAGAGAAASPWLTLQKAADTVKAGDTVTVQAGTYAGFELTTAHSGTANAEITFAAQSGVVINRAGPDSPDAINLEGASYITIEGFSINNKLGTITRGGIRAVTDQHVTIQNNTVDGAGDWNIFTGFSDDVLIQNNVASHAVTQHGIYVSNSGDRPIIRNNVVFGNHNCGIHMNGDISEGGDGIISDAVVEGNIIYDNGVGGGSAINADGVQDSLFANNLIYDNFASGISLFKMDGGGPSSGNVVTNNTIVMPTNARWCVNIQNGSINNTVTNNILDNQNSGHGAITISSDSLKGFVSDYNVVINNHFTPNGNTIETLAQWQSDTGQDLHSILSTEAATFVDAVDNGYRLFAGSSAVDRGTAANAPATDLAGMARATSGGVDIGAYALQQNETAPITPAGTQIMLTTSDGSITAGDGVTVTATVTAAGRALSISASGVDVNGFGNVTLMDGSAVVGTGTVNAAGDASFTLPSLKVGSHTLTAIYSGDASYAGSTSGSIVETVLAKPIIPPYTPPVVGPIEPTGKQTAVSLNGRFNTTGIDAAGSTFYKRAGLDGLGDAYSASALGTSITVGGSNFSVRPGNMTNVVSAKGQAVKLPKGHYSELTFLGTGVNGVQSGTFTVQYTDGSSQTFTQTMSDWSASSNEAGEVVAKTMGSYVNYAGKTVQRTTNIYAYSMALDPTKTVKSITLPTNANMKVMAMDLLA